MTTESTIYEILDKFGLLFFTKSQLIKRIQQLSAQEIESLREETLQFYSNSLPRLIVDIKSRSTRVNLLPGPQMLVMPSNPITRKYKLDTFLPKSILYADSIIAHDPLHRWFYSNVPTDIGNYFRLSVPDKRKRLYECLSHLIYLKPLVESNVVFLVPMSAIDELFNERLFQLVNEFMVNVQFLKTCEESLIIERRGTKVYFYLYSPSQFWGHKLSTSGGDIEKSKKEYFKIHAEWLIRDTLRGQILGAGPCAINPGEWRLLQIITSENLNGKNLAAASMRDLELPWLDRTPIEKIISIRKNEEIFQTFRQNVEHFFSHVRAIPGEEDFRKDIERMKQELILPSLRRIDTKLRQLQRNSFLDAAIAIASLSISGLTGNLSASIPAVISLYKMVSNVISSPSDLEREPAYFLWKLRHD